MESSARPTAASGALADGALAGAVATLDLAGPADGLPLVVASTLRQLDGLPPTSALLQEMPDPLTSISWGGWVELHPTTASALGVVEGDVIGLEGTAGHTELPAHLTVGLRAGVVAVPVGYALPLLDRTHALRSASGRACGCARRAPRFRRPTCGRVNRSMAPSSRARSRPREGCPWRPPCLR